MENIGFIGLGTMGRPMAGNLLTAGYSVFGYSRSSLPESLLKRGLAACHSSAEVSNKSEIIITMLPDSPDVEQVLFGPSGVAEGLTAGKTVVDMSSISPFATRDLATRIGKLGCAYLDAPVSGGELGAIAATLTIMVGGAAEDFERVKPIFEAMGKNITLVGGNGDGQTAKIANQIIVALTIQAVAEALIFASKAGADPAKVRQALMGGFASSKILEVHGQRMLERNCEPGFRIELHRKDLSLATIAARKLNLALPGTAICEQLLNSAIAHAGGSWDHSGLVRVLEQLANHTIGM